ncbi:MAG: iron ABC transporter permease [Deltaproteobacteria bacterium]|nr:iron ABC transporter permease [Deltaproteobacteria bacterium]
MKLTKLYKDKIKKRILLFWSLFAALLLLCMFSVTSGVYDISVSDIIKVLCGKSENNIRIIILNIRMPRVLAAVISGWGLAAAGVIIQALLKNPLGSPSTLGISQGAAFGVSLAIVIFGTQNLDGAYYTGIFAFIGALGTIFIILALVKIKKLSYEAIILAGVALSSLFNSGTILIRYFADETELAASVFWIFGDVARSNIKETGILTIITLTATLWLFFNKWNLNAISAGEETAKGLGVSVEKIRFTGMIIAAFLAALITAFHGVISFLGLLSPHIAKMLTGEDYRLLIPFSCIIGALLLVGADTSGRLIIGSGALPVGVLTSFMGAPLFLYLLIKGYKK